MHLGDVRNDLRSAAALDLGFSQAAQVFHAIPRLLMASA